jgi:predicted nucleic acid-binding protein
VKVVADTNVLVSALIFPGGPTEAFYRLALEDRIELVTSRSLLTELGSVLVEKFGWDPPRSEDAIAQLVRMAEIAPKAEIIVSGDRHLLASDSWRGIAVQSPAAFVASFDG